MYVYIMSYGVSHDTIFLSCVISVRFFIFSVLTNAINYMITVGRGIEIIEVKCDVQIEYCL